MKLRRLILYCVTAKLLTPLKSGNGGLSKLVIRGIILSFILSKLMSSRPLTTKAAILVAQSEPLVVDTIELPASLESGQVLVELYCSGVCGSQLGEIDGVKGPDKFLPHLLGHEGFAKVLEIGPGVSHVKAGDSVVLHWRPGAGIQSQPRYRWRDKTLNAGWVTTFNQHAVVSENRCTRIPSDNRCSSFVWLRCDYRFGVIENNAKLKMGESVVVFGAGGIGLNIVQAASLFLLGLLLPSTFMRAALSSLIRWALPTVSTAPQWMQNKRYNIYLVILI